jgi:hypothetical protein
VGAAFRFSPDFPALPLDALPDFKGRPIEVLLRGGLTAHRGRLLSASPLGTPVHAGSFLRERRIVLDAQLVHTPHRLMRIFVHEVFHFVWTRLGNPVRRSYEELIAAEIRRGATGELGWSAETRRLDLRPGDMSTRSRAWRLYTCESFCDTAAWRFGTTQRYAEVTLPPFYRRARREWIDKSLPTTLPT